jgi:hypothetical protein
LEARRFQHGFTSEHHNGITFVRFSHAIQQYTSFLTWQDSSPMTRVLKCEKYAATKQILLPFSKKKSFC